MATILLTPQLKKRVEEQIHKSLKIAEKHFDVKLPFPEIRYDVKSWISGLAYTNQNLIRFNLILLVENEEEFIKTTVVHEAAHMIVNELFRQGKFKLSEKSKKIMPHGKEWKEVMGVLNTPPRVKHNYNVSSIEKKPRKTPKISGRKKKDIDSVFQSVLSLDLKDQRALLTKITNLLK